MRRTSRTHAPVREARERRAGCATSTGLALNQAEHDCADKSHRKIGGGDAQSIEERFSGIHGRLPFRDAVRVTTEVDIRSGDPSASRSSDIRVVAMQHVPEGRIESGDARAIVRRTDWSHRAARLRGGGDPHHIGEVAFLV